MDRKLCLLEDVSYLSSLATAAVVSLDDLTEKLEASEELENRVAVPRAELAAAEATVRKVLDRVFNVKSSVRAEILATRQSRNPNPETPGEAQAPLVPGASEAEAAESSEVAAAEAARPGPFDFESCVLPNAAARNSAEEAQ